MKFRRGDIVIASASAVDKLITLHRDHIAKKIGEADAVTMQQVTRALAAFLDIG